LLPVLCSTGTEGLGRIRRINKAIKNGVDVYEGPIEFLHQAHDGEFDDELDTLLRGKAAKARGF
jgi:hypothetical protein